MAQEARLQCAGELEVIEQDCYLAIHCKQNPSHYSAHVRKPGAPYLWGAGFHLEEKPEQLTLGGAA
jgi:hypothetical protein